MNEQEKTETIGRLALAAVGTLAGASVWVLVDVLPDMIQDQPRLFLFLAVLAAVFFSAWMGMTGPLRLSVAGLGAAVLALPLAGLVTWASLRFDAIEPFLSSGHPGASMAILGFVPLPFLISKVRAGRWACYEQLFSQSWNIVVRYAAAWLFVALAWGVVGLSDALLNLVGIDVIEWLIEQEPVPYLLTGMALGVALAVVNELSGYVSPFLALRLLRLLLPVVLGVVVVFLVALPFRGLSHLFGEFSAATTLLAMAMGATTLVTTALDAEADRAVHTPTMRVATEWMALLIPALAGLAGLAIWMRVAQYGWTPDRLAAATLAALVMGYGVTYAVAVLRRGDWGRHIRHANIWMAVIAMGVAALWLTPVFNPQRIATADQLARYRAEKVTAQELDLWTIGREWGRPGRDGLAVLAAMTDHPDGTVMAERLAQLADAENRYAFEQSSGQSDVEGLIGEIRDRLVIRPLRAVPPEELLGGLRQWELQELAQACERITPKGNRGCVLLLTELSERHPGEEAVLVTSNARGGPVLRAYFREEDGGDFVMRSPEFLSGGDFYRAGNEVIDALIEGEFTLRSFEVRALVLEGREVIFGR